MQGPSARALREGGIGGSIPYKIGVTLLVKLSSGGPLPPEWRKKTVLQAPFGDYGQILRIDCQEAQGVAFIEFEDKRDAEDAEHEMNGKQILGKSISVTLARAPDQRFGLGRTVDIEERIAELARRHRLDEAATARLASVFHDRARLGCDLNRDFEELNEHLAASNKPSALVSMKLADLRAGRSIGPCKYAGSGPRRGTGMCEVDEPYHMGNGLQDSRSDGHGREHRERRPRSRDRERSRERRPRLRDEGATGGASPRSGRVGREAAPIGAASRVSPRPGHLEALPGEGRHAERQREPRPVRGRQELAPPAMSSESCDVAGRREQERATGSRSRLREKRAREGRPLTEQPGQDGAPPKERSSGSSGSRQLRRRRPAKEKAVVKEPRKEGKRKQRKRSASLSGASAGRAAQKRPRSNSSAKKKARAAGPRKKAKSSSPGRQRRCKSGNGGSSDDSG